MRRARGTLTLAALAAATTAGAGACDHLSTGDDGALTGTWRYRATGVEVGRFDDGGGSTCAFETTFAVTQRGAELEGVSEAAPQRCLTADGRAWSDTFPAGVVRGEVRADGRLYVTIAGNWHSFGAVGADRVEGHLEVYEARVPDPVVPHRTGSFVMERLSGDGYGGPPL